MSSRATGLLWRNFRTYNVFGANTDVGKTIFSTLLCRTASKPLQHQQQHHRNNVWYLKPVSTGALNEADTSRLTAHAPRTTTQNFYQFGDPVSPHIAAGTTVVQDAHLLAQLTDQIRKNAAQGPGMMIVETAGGPHSPAPSGTSQADLLRPLRLPTLFVADWRLGGISTSIASFESLRARGFDVEGVAVCQDATYRNYEYLGEYFAKLGVPVLTMPLPPDQVPGKVEDPGVMRDYYQQADEGVNGGLSAKEFDGLLEDRHQSRIARLESLAETAHSNIWYPFQQHRGLTPQKLNVIDSAYGDYFQTLSKEVTPGAGAANDNDTTSLLQATVDGSASWWTQGLGHANNTLTEAAAYAAGRYGHVMFAEGANEPAVALAEQLLAALGNPRLARVFYSDNGSTGTEVGMKMALKAASMRYGWADDEPVEIIGLNNSYHGDTIGAMDMSEPSVFNKKVNWYKGRGFWFDTPSVQMRQGTWTVSKPAGANGELGGERSFKSLAAIFDPARDTSDDAKAYEAHIRTTLERLTRDEKRKFGGLVMEPVVLGAGGMILVDPLFQRVLVNVVRASTDLFSHGAAAAAPDDKPHTWSGLPVVTDEVFAGLYRLGHRTASSLLRIQPDISVHAKLLTGGLLPLACTVASEAVFAASLSPHKADALLHGHSYTAHPVGCSVALASLRLLAEQDSGGAWDGFKADWAGRGSSVSAELLGAVKDLARGAVAPEAGGASVVGEVPAVWSVWSSGFVTALSKKAGQVDGVWALGSVLAIEVHDAQGAGYTSDAARVLQQRLLADDGQAQGWNIHSRVLGNVLYLMTSQVTAEAEVRAWEGRVLAAMQG